MSTPTATANASVLPQPRAAPWFIFFDFSTSHTTPKLDETPLLRATQKKNSEGVRLLLQHGASMLITDKEGTSPLMESAANGDTACATLLAQACESVGCAQVNLLSFSLLRRNQCHSNISTRLDRELASSALSPFRFRLGRDKHFSAMQRGRRRARGISTCCQYCSHCRRLPQKSPLEPLQQMQRATQRSTASSSTAEAKWTSRATWSSSQAMMRRPARSPPPLKARGARHTVRLARLIFAVMAGMNEHPSVRASGPVAKNVPTPSSSYSSSFQLGPATRRHWPTT